MMNEYKPFWEAPQRLLEVTFPRQIFVEANSDLGRFAEGYQAIQFSGTAGAFGAQKWIDGILSQIRQRIKPLPSLWNSQRRFFETLFRQFYMSVPAELPAWVQLREIGLSFKLRNSVVEEYAFPPIPLMSANHTRKGQLLFHSAPLSLDRLALARLPLSERKSLRLRQSFVSRFLQTEGSRCLSAVEEWLFLEDDCINEQYVLSGGTTPISPVSQHFFDIESLRHRAPLVSLCRLRPGGKRMDILGITLTLEDSSHFIAAGEVADFRLCQYDLEYYFRSSADNLQLCELLLDHHAFQRF